MTLSKSEMLMLAAGNAGHCQPPQREEGTMPLDQTKYDEMNIDGQVIILCPICPDYRSIVWTSGPFNDDNRADVEAKILAVHNSTPSHRKQEQSR